MPRSRLRGCTNCRERHLRCDRATPACSNCSKPKNPRECIYGDLEVRHSCYSAKFLEKRGQGSGNAIPSSPSDTQGSTSPPHTSAQAGPEFVVSASEPSPAVAQTIPTAIQLHDSHSPQLASPPTRANATNPELGQVQAQSTRNLESLCVLDEFWSPNVSQTQDAPLTTPSSLPFNSSLMAASRRTVKNNVEEFIFGFYLSHAGPWLDIASSRQHFGRTVPRLALKDPVLYHACLAYASRVLLLHGMLDECVYGQYTNEAISMLIPLLSSDCVRAGSGALLSTAVILRMSEQFSELAEDAKYHLCGACSLFTAVQEKWSPSYTCLRGAAFWTYVRESIRVCFLKEEGCQFDLNKVDGDLPKSSSGYDEEVWANHMSYLLARLCNACWGKSDAAESTVSALGKIRGDIDKWRAGLPHSYQPWYSHHEQHQTFRVIKFLSPWHGNPLHPTFQP
ncbi:hypothetical protein FOVG_07141 [Fusarium oxysporum f. sp. pisi HDV247]|uniref:Zn(2)-C6 fungal-type domain-containing protein n=1 Tax=Fusarium oxysporum f. sp. pisi HDV247 TaxID=1080344 RepID=W9PTV0_FUSOX|nr:hypothetical protein FOVG_07141 [Fusarium oxysporum f. sp. pisi HDV247]